MRFTNLKRCRLERGILQVELAQRTAIERSRLSLIENGHVAPTPAELERIALVLGVPIDMLMPEPRSAAVGGGAVADAGNSAR